MDARITKMQEMLEDVSTKIQGLHITATAGNVNAISGAITTLQILYNTLAVMQNETGGGENGDG